MAEEPNKAENDQALRRPDTLADAEALAVTSVSTWLGFPVPPTIAKSVFRAVAALVGATVALPIEWLQGRVRESRALSEGRARVIDKMAREAAKRIGEEDEIADRAVQFFGERVLREQRTREGILRQALEDVRTTPPTEEAEQLIDEDWLEMFARHAESKTQTDVQRYFARVLAGEIRKPGTFSAETIEILSKLSAEAGRLFQGLCNLTAEVPGLPPFVFTEPYGSPGTNALAPLGFGYDQLCRLQDAGLVRNDLTSYVEMPPAVLQRVTVGGKVLQFQIKPEPAVTAGAPPTPPSIVLEKRKFKVLRLTVAGHELSQIVHMIPNETYIAKFVEWAQQFRLTPNT